MNLESIRLSEEIKTKLVQIGYQKLTDIQSKVIPHVLEKKDVVAQSRTGTGKTAAFLIPILDAGFWRNRQKQRQPQVLILEPTRELALQVSKEAQKLTSSSNNLKIITVYGQESLHRQAQILHEGVDIVVGTLGRVEHHLRENNFKINELKFLVLDEVDEMINEGFLPTTEWIIERIPSTCQILLFSATVSTEVENFAKRFLKKPIFIVSQPEQSQVANIQQHYLKVSPNKNQTLINLVESLNQNKPVLILVFANTKRQVEVVSKVIRKQEKLRQKGLVIDFLHGDLRQRKRIKILEKFRNRQISLLVVTDVLGRGIHIDNVDYVINYDIPQNPASYTHRIGRTGRAESTGVALTLVSSDVEIKELLKIARRQKFEIKEYKLNS
ncbi:MAG: RNA helicase [Mycoplasmataceae bacterium RC_NB112A]|nr:MAG: RNA helicase [Mycoplasmataceae bacterium RC_NB112A]